MEYGPQFLTIAAVFLLGAMSPGPDFIAVTSQALVSRSAGLRAALGIAVACIVWAVLALAGLELLLVRLAWLYELIRYLGAAYLIYLGISVLLSVRKTSDNPDGVDVSGLPRSAFWHGFTVCITNPKVAAYFGSLLITVLPLDAPLWVHATTVGLIASLAAIWFGLVALFFSLSGVRRVYGRLRRPIDAVLGAFLVLLGVRIALSR